MPTTGPEDVDVALDSTIPFFRILRPTPAAAWRYSYRGNRQEWLMLACVFIGLGVLPMAGYVYSLGAGRPLGLPTVYWISALLACPLLVVVGVQIGRRALRYQLELTFESGGQVRLAHQDKVRLGAERAPIDIDAVAPLDVCRVVLQAVLIHPPDKRARRPSEGWVVYVEHPEEAVALACSRKREQIDRYVAALARELAVKLIEVDAPIDVSGQLMHAYSGGRALRRAVRAAEAVNRAREGT